MNVVYGMDNATLPFQFNTNWIRDASGVSYQLGMSIGIYSAMVGRAGLDATDGARGATRPTCVYTNFHCGMVSVSIGSGPLGGIFIKNFPTYSDTRRRE